MRMIGTKEAANILGVSRETLTAWRRDKKGPPWVKYGASDTHKVVYDEADLVRFMALLKQGTTTMPLDPNPDEVLG